MKSSLGAMRSSHALPSATNRADDINIPQDRRTVVAEAVETLGGQADEPGRLRMKFVRLRREDRNPVPGWRTGELRSPVRPLAGARCAYSRHPWRSPSGPASLFARSRRPQSTHLASNPGSACTGLFHVDFETGSRLSVHPCTGRDECILWTGSRVIGHPWPAG